MFPENNLPVPDPNNPQAQPSGRNNREKPKKPKESFALKPELFQTKKGLRSLYERTKELKLDDHSEINVENTMKKLVVLLKSWHLQMVPKYYFDYFIQRCQALGTHKRLSAYMSKVRKIHKGQDTWQQVGTQQAQNQQQKPQQQEKQQLYNGRMFEQTNQALKMMNSYAVQPKVHRPQNQQMDDEDDEQLMKLMYQVQKKHKKVKSSDEEGQQNQPYMPEGFQVQYEDQEGQ